MARKKTTKQPDVVFREPPYIPQTPISEAAKRVIYKEAGEHWTDLCDYYGATDTVWEDMPLNVQKRVQAILGAPDQEKAREADRKARAAMLMTLLHSWAKRRIPGPDKVETWIKLGKRATALAKMLERKGDDDGARRQWTRAEEYEARVLAATPLKP